jgi:F-type H+-transporting ATPase subunit delta
MKTATATNPTAVAYARSLLELATEGGQADEVGREMAGVRELLEQNPTFAAFLADPGIGAAERTATLEKLFRGRASPLVFNFLGVVNNHGRMRLLGPIAQAYGDLLDAQKGNVEVDVTVAQRLTPDQLEQVRQRVSQSLGRNAIVHQYVDEDIIGGLVLRVEDRLIDASVRYQLEAMRERLLAARRKQ